MDASTVPPRITALLEMIDCKALHKACQRVPAGLWELGAEDLDKIAKPTNTDKEVRFELWKGITNYVEKKDVIEGKYLYRNHCSYTHFWYGILQKPEKVVWLLAPVNALNTEIRNLISMSLDNLRKIILSPSEKKNGALDHRIMNLQVKIFMYLYENFGDEAREGRSRSKYS